MTTATRFYKGDLVTVDSAADGVFDAVVERMEGEHIIVLLPEDLASRSKKRKMLYPSHRVRSRVPAPPTPLIIVEASSTMAITPILGTEHHQDVPEAVLPAVEVPVAKGRTWTCKLCQVVKDVPEGTNAQRVASSHQWECPARDHAAMVEGLRKAQAKSAAARHEGALQRQEQRAEVTGMVDGIIEVAVPAPQPQPAMTLSPGIERVLARLERIAEMVQDRDCLDPVELELTGREMYELLVYLERFSSNDFSSPVGKMRAFLFALMERPYGIVSIRGSEGN